MGPRDVRDELPVLPVVEGDIVPLDVEFPSFPGLRQWALVVPPPGKKFAVQGVRSFNAHQEITIRRISHGMLGDVVILGRFDSAAYSLHGDLASADDPNGLLAYHPVRWGMITRDLPLRIDYHCWGFPAMPPDLHWTLYGYEFSEDGLTRAVNYKPALSCGSSGHHDWHRRNIEHGEDLVRCVRCGIEYGETALEEDKG